MYKASYPPVWRFVLHLTTYPHIFSERWKTLCYHLEFAQKFTLSWPVHDISSTFPCQTCIVSFFHIFCGKVMEQPDFIVLIHTLGINAHILGNYSPALIHPVSSVKRTICMWFSTVWFASTWLFRYPRKPVDNFVEKRRGAFIDAAFNRLHALWAYLSLHDFRLFYPHKPHVLDTRHGYLYPTGISNNMMPKSFSFRFADVRKKTEKNTGTGWKKRHSSRSIWRKGRDLNPRYGVTVYRISSPAHSTTLPPFRILNYKQVELIIIAEIPCIS